MMRLDLRIGRKVEKTGNLRSPHEDLRKNYDKFDLLRALYSSLIIIF